MAKGPYRTIGCKVPRDDVYTERIVRNDKRNEFVCQETIDLLRTGFAPALVFVRMRIHAHFLAARLGMHLGLEVPVVTSQLPIKQREELRKAINEGHIPVAICTSVWSTGVDIPNLRGLVLAGGGEAPIGLIQTAGRTVRKKDGEFQIVDIGDVGIPRYEEQAQRRVEHLAKEGYAVEGVSPAVALMRDLRDNIARPEADGFEDIECIHERPPMTVGQFFHIALAIFVVIAVIVGAFAE